ncbi:pancreatic progenitor cell differentiation and proliferation factor-like protein [Phascolarctos cinereus]|uniref:Pancreatic progenitor cell differentiation and proliferation factor-like protein n=1 Tax=Phascolarctos cinereus TaxID=38626 RepID=A0A6P5KXR7_PHACI|nr:pancreatic progenitor cell differentiation and proliferation factor-like protein [Phascolarctos cinereus]
MASVSIAGCLLTQNRYYQKSSICSVNSFTGFDSVNFTDMEKAHPGLPEAAESNWWFKSFFHSDPAPPDKERKDLFITSISS